MAVGLLTLILSVSGCQMEYRVVQSGWDDFPQDPKPAAADPALSNGAGWAVALHQFTGPRHQEEARHLLRRLEQQRGVDDLWLGGTAGTTTVYRGRYGDQARARRMLQRTQRLRFDGERPFAAAALVPLGHTQDAAGGDPRDLQQFAGQFSLQIGYYDERHDIDRREAAEAAVERLREAGHEAYYYHGPHRSMVTIGVFEYEAAFVPRDDPRTSGSTVDVYAPHIRELQRRFPYSLANVDDILEQQKRPQEQDVQPSGLVNVF